MPSPPLAVVGAEEAVAEVGVEAVEVAVAEVVGVEVAAAEVAVRQEVPQVAALVETPAPAARARVVQDQEIPVIKAVQEPMLHPLAATTLRAPKEIREKVTPALQAMRVAAGVPADLADLEARADRADREQVRVHLAARPAQEQPASPVLRPRRSEARPAPFSPIPGPGGSALRVRYSGP
jgi:hypothetical protein